ncbi:hypothetical protein NHX12_006108, partial [Muraenolepis orangiensis]
TRLVGLVSSSRRLTASSRSRASQTPPKAQGTRSAGGPLLDDETDPIDDYGAHKRLTWISPGHRQSLQGRKS